MTQEEYDKLMQLPREELEKATEKMSLVERDALLKMINASSANKTAYIKHYIGQSVKVTGPLGEGEFQTAIGRAVNQCSRENGSNTPDFILAAFVSGCLHAFDLAVNAREEWYDHPNNGPGGQPQTLFDVIKILQAELKKRTPGRYHATMDLLILENGAMNFGNIQAVPADGDPVRPST